MLIFYLNMSDTFYRRLNVMWQHFISDPKKWLRFIVLFACSIVVFFQLSECFWKLSHPPVTTHSHFELNDTLTYPAITFCRVPGYKADVMKQYNLATEIKLTNAWKYFPYNTTNLDEFFQLATYGPSEYFLMYALQKSQDNVRIVSTVNFYAGQCQTFLPLVTTKGSWKEYGYSVFLKHDTYPNESVTEYNGWELYIHEAKENFVENAMKLSGRVENIFIHVSEEVEIKLTVQDFQMIADGTCSSDENHSVIETHESCEWEYVTSEANCSGPWMPSIDLPYCQTYSQMKALILTYQQLANSSISVEGCVDIEPCRSMIYSAYVVNRSPLINQEIPSSHIYLYYTSKMVSIFQEVPAYDLSQFVADMGGSLGFLLGLSVLGLIGILEKVIYLLFGGWIEKKYQNDEGTVIKNNHERQISESNDNEITAESPATLKQKEQDT